MSSTYRVVKLLKNHLYPTYQLHAFMANDKTTPQDGLRLAALTTMHWLKTRLGDDVPEEWKALPSPEEYLSATDEDLPSLYINQGHVVNIVSLPDKGMWTLQITEPDLGSDPGNPEQSRPAIPGRIIETNIAFLIVGKQLECGFKTIISDPVGTEPEAEVYRIAVVRQLMKNPAFGLKQVMDIPMTAIRLTIGFPLISAGIFGYPLDLAWKEAITACEEFLLKHPGMKVVFAVLNDDIIAKGQETLRKWEADHKAETKAAPAQTSEAEQERDDDFGVWMAQEKGLLKTHYRIFTAKMGGFRDSANYEFIAEFESQKLTGNYIEFMRGKKRYSDKDIIVQKVYVKKTPFGEETTKGKVVSVITVLGEELHVDEYEFK